MSEAMRRVITGLDGEGRSCVLIDGPPLAFDGGKGGGALVWETALPADNASTADCTAGAFSFERMHAGNAIFMVMEFGAENYEFWHATDTVEFIAMLSGEIVFQTETGEVTLRAGDVLVDRGVVHSWRNDSGRPARAAITMLPAHPAGKGRTV